MRTRGTGGAVPVLLGLLALAGCSAPEPDPHGPASVALRMFELSDVDPAAEELDALFDPLQLSRRRVELLEALDGLTGGAQPTVLGVQTSPGGDEAFVDLELGLPGAGLAVYNVKLHRTDEENWRIAWFQGPGVEWPSRSSSGPSLSTSAPPRTGSDD